MGGFDETKFGPSVRGDTTDFRVWAPSASCATLLLRGARSVALDRDTNGFSKMLAVGPGCHYRFEIDGLKVPDLASRQQAEDADGWSVVRSPIPPSSRAKPLRPWHEAIICEVHVGTATPDGTFAARASRLEHF